MKKISTLFKKLPNGIYSQKNLGILARKNQIFHANIKKITYQGSLKFSTDEKIIDIEDQVQNKKNVENLEFKAETKKLLDIVAKSLYTDKDVFIRELLSNSSDALEKLRFYQTTGVDTTPGDPLQIQVLCNENKKQIIIQDTGIGMTRKEMIENLGTIASSGSRRFIEEVEKNSSQTMSENIIGQFGVGFYSAFITGDSVEVVSKQKGHSAYLWTSDGSGTYEISEVDNVDFERGTQIKINLRPNCLQFCKQDEVKKIIDRYSNFINFPIYLNGEKLNNISAIWAKNKSDVTGEQYEQFWEYISNSKIQFKYKLHYSTDAPLSIKSLLFAPSTHMEKFGVQMEEMNVHLYSKKVLIKQNCKEILPNWLRFIKGVVDCEDLPLNISRENYQDSGLIAKLRNIMTKRVIKMLEEESKKDEAAYLQWYNDFQYFLKEGLATDQENAESILTLMRYNGNWKNGFVTIDDYIKQLKPGQDKIYYLLAPNRDAALNSPYMEPFKKTNIPILFLYIHVDEMVFRSLNEYKKKYKFVNIETNFEEISKDIESAQPISESQQDQGVNEDELTPFCLWIKNELSPVVTKVHPSKRLSDSPALIVGQISSGMRQVMSMLDKEQTQNYDQNLTMEINPSHEIIKKLNKVRKTDPKISQLIVKQLLDNSLISAGIVSDPKQYVSRVNKLMDHVLSTAQERVSIEDSKEAYREMMTDESEQEDRENQERKFDAEIIIDKDGNPQVVKGEENLSK